MTGVALITVVFYQNSVAQTNVSTDVPRIMSYQGQITNSDGSAMNGTHTITASLYSDHYGRTSVWSGSYDAEVKNGLFNILLGAGRSPLPAVQDLNRPMWVGIKVDGGSEMRPLTQLAGVPYALNIPDQSVTAAKLAPELMTQLKGSTAKPMGVPNRIALSDGAGTTFGAGTQGTTTTVLHGNAAGSPTYGSVDLANDVTGTLGAANGGTGGTSGGWTLTGNSGTTAGTNFVGTTDSTAFEIHVNDGDATANRGSKRVMRYEPNAASPNIIGGFQGNIIRSDMVGSVIGGGGSNSNKNEIRSTYSVISGGRANLIDSNCNNSVIVAGSTNYIGRGAKYSYIGSGKQDTIREGAEGSAIIGGEMNLISDSSKFGFIGGGNNNIIINKALNATIPGGDSLIGQSYGQTVMGYYNVAQGTSTPTNLIDTDDIFIIGNGTAGNRSDAFQVSRKGHSTVHHTNDYVHRAIVGGTYKDNIVYAWGYFTAGHTPALDRSFGVFSITAAGAGYHVVLNLEDPSGTGACLKNNDVAVIVTPYGAGDACIYPMVNNLTNSGNTTTSFDIEFYHTVLLPPCPLGCSPPRADYSLDCQVATAPPFMFIVVGRPF